MEKIQIRLIEKKFTVVQQQPLYNYNMRIICAKR